MQIRKKIQNTDQQDFYMQYLSLLYTLCLMFVY